MILRRFVFRDDLPYEFFHVLTFSPRHLIQLIELLSESVGVYGERVADKDPLILGLSQSFLRHQKLLIELLSGTQPGKFDFDILIRLKS